MKGHRVATTSTKTAVSESSRMLRATSLGVFWRSEPSTRAIIRSTNEWPGSEVIRTTMRSERTTVPPVTAHRSPPDSRITGADSPVTADSSTVATPSMTSPSPGMRSPASTTTTSPARRLPLGTSSTGRVISPPVETRSAAPAMRRAVVVCWRVRRLAACALPRPSATASARVPKSTVSHSHSVMETENSDGSSTVATVVTTAPTSTTRSTGLSISSRGLILASARRKGTVTGVPPRSGRAPGRGRT